MLVASHSSPAILASTQAASGQRIQLDVYTSPTTTTAAVAALPAALPAPVSAHVLIQPQAQEHQQTEMVQQAPKSPPLVPVHERLLAAQIAHLASQHHGSEYSRFKFGQKGAPVAYIPLSIQAPLHLRELRARQAAATIKQKAWWLSEQVEVGNSSTAPREENSLLKNEEVGQTLPTMLTSPSSDIQQEISAAISSQMPSAHITKTSQSHPINISMLIPFELISTIASHLTSPLPPSSVIFNLPERYYLDRVTVAPTHGALTFKQPFRTGNPILLPSVQPRVPITWAHPGSSELLQSTLNGDFTFTSPRSFFTTLPQQNIKPRAEPPSPQFSFQAPAPTPPSPPKGVIRRQPRHGRATSAPPGFQPLNQRRSMNFKELRQHLPRNRSNPEAPIIRSSETPSILPSAVRVTESVSEGDCGNGFWLSNNTKEIRSILPPTSVALDSVPQSKPDLSSPRLENPVPQQLGNMYLSSCPGKKVRLSGPVKGRGAICRDLRADLSRVKEIGVGCIICCLDDTELSFLGASWQEYSSIANELGLDILRIPMPEGLAPHSAASLDAYLNRIIKKYTLHGVPVLAHCRGGVGRAGLVACCWMLKLGLCGWRDEEICRRSCSEHASCRRQRVDGPRPFALDTAQTYAQTQAHTGVSATANVPRVCRATVQLVERAISVMRRQRSLKALETYEQVRFLVDFIDYLDAEARAKTLMA